MTSMSEIRADRSPDWLRWAREIDALASSGAHFARNEYERDRALRLQEIAAEIIAKYSDLTDSACLLALQAQGGYITPKIDVRGAVFQGGNILLVREQLDGTWTMPGGWADVGETPRQAVEREVFEESGLTVHARRVIGIYDANRVEDALSLFHAYKLLFLCVSHGGDLQPSHETSEVGFFPIDSLPGELSEFRTTPRHLHDAIVAHGNPEQPVVFD
jgi:ADP-ribose pyrophosphatase YjhB (NUDIX family)